MTNATRAVLVWDIPIRVFHWLLVALVAAAFATLRLNWIGWHERIGDALLALLVFRVLWGVLGSDTARFSQFLTSPQRAVRHLSSVFLSEPDRQPGHNPAGGWMVLFLLGLLFAETLTGLYVTNDIADVGPLTDVVPAALASAIEAAHAMLWSILLAAIVLHALAIASYALVKRQNLVRPMITGTKLLPAAVPAPRIVGPASAIALLAAAAAASAFLVRGL